MKENFGEFIESDSKNVENQISFSMKNVLNSQISFLDSQSSTAFQFQISSTNELEICERHLKSEILHCMHTNSEISFHANEIQISFELTQTSKNNWNYSLRYFNLNFSPSLKFFTLIF